MRHSGKKWVCGIVLMVLGMTGLSWGQPGGGGGGGGRGGFGGPGNFDPAQMRQRMNERMMQQLGVTEEEWKVIEPLYTKVTDLQRSTRGRGGFGMRGGFGGRGGRNRGGMGAQDQNAEPTALEKAQQELSTLLENDSATPEQIKAKLATLRKERDKVHQELVQAQENLRKVLSVKQEAQLVLMGTLE